MPYTNFTIIFFFKFYLLLFSTHSLFSYDFFTVISEKKKSKKKQSRKKIQLKFTVDCTHPVEDGIMDAATFVSVLHSALERISYDCENGITRSRHDYGRNAECFYRGHSTDTVTAWCGPFHTHTKSALPMKGVEMSRISS